MDIPKVVEILLQAEAIVIFAGAGMSVDSGMPDFRGNKGFWNAYPKAEELGLSFVDTAAAEIFDKNQRLAWAFYGHRLDLYRKTLPHEGYKNLLNLCDSKPGGYFVFTSNVDGHFQKAGFDSQRIVECHGSIHRLQCVEPCDEHVWGVNGIDIEIDDNFLAQKGLPKCSLCGDVARPNILMFNDRRWVKDVVEKQKMDMYYWWQGVQREKLKVAVLEIGAGTAIKTVRNQSETYANYEFATFIRINPTEYLTEYGVGLTMTAMEALNHINDY